MARILHIIRADRGGAFANVAQLSEALMDAGHEAVVVGPVDPGRLDPRARVIGLPIARPVSPAADLVALRRFASIVRRTKPDLVHGHGSKGGMLARAARAVAPRTPVVFTPHLYAFANYFASPAERRAYRAIERVLAPLATRVTACCEAERRLAAEVGPASRTRLVYNGIEAVSLDEVHPRVAELRDGGPVICAIAELRNSKGIPRLVEAMSIVSRDHPEARLVIAGDGPERELVESTITRLGLARTVVMLGATDGPGEVLAGSSVFVNAAYAEAFPYTVIEAMSARVPVIATDVGGTIEAIGPQGSAGLLIPPGDTTALAQAIASLLREPARARSMAEDAERRYRRRFTRQRMVDAAFGVYAELGIAV